MTTEVQTYSNELLFALRMRGVPGPKIAEALAEMHSHLTETGESPRESFGSPQAYADEIAAALGGPDSSVPLWRSILTWSTAAYGIGGWVGTWLLLDGLRAATSGQRAPLHLPASASVLLGLAMLAALAVAFGRLARRPDTQVLDPRTGEDMTPPRPRWVLPVMVAPPVLILLAAIVAVVQR